MHKEDTQWASKEQKKFKPYRPGPLVMLFKVANMNMTTYAKVIGELGTFVAETKRDEKWKDGNRNCIDFVKAAVDEVEVPLTLNIGMSLQFV